MRVLGVFAAERDPLAPDVPTLDEQGIASGNIGSPVTVFAPLGTDPAAIAAMAAALQTASGSAAYADALKPQGLAPAFRDAATADANLTAIAEAAAPVIDDLKASN